MKIAVSYRRVDESRTLDLLVKALIDRFGKENVYSDVESTKLGEDWLLRWSSSYVSADCILIVIGPNWNPERLRDPGDPVKLELWAARHGVTMVPVLIDGARMPERKQLPRELWWLPGKQGVVIDQQQPAESIATLLSQLPRAPNLLLVGARD